MDIRTEKGQQSLRYENEMLNSIRKRFDVDIIETNKDSPALCDGFMVRNGIITGVFESKCRKATIEDFRKWGSWLITYEKIDGLAWMSNKLCIPALGFLYSIPDDIVLMWHITDREGNYKFEFKVEKTITQATINGGKAERENAYLPIDKAQNFWGEPYRSNDGIV